MRRRYVVIGLALIAALAVASPGFGLSIKQMIKKEVAKQISKAQGPAGANGTNGTNGTNGAPGTARAYGQVNSQANNPCSPDCGLSNSKGITNVTRIGTGVYCVHAPGIDGADVAAVADAAFGPTNSPEGNGSALTFTDCTGGGFQVNTERLNPATATATSADDVGFTIVIP
jgi:hypothetical protein